MCHAIFSKAITTGCQNIRMSHLYGPQPITLHWLTSLTMSWNCLCLTGGHSLKSISAFFLLSSSVNNQYHHQQLITAETVGRRTQMPLVNLWLWEKSKSVSSSVTMYWYNMLACLARKVYTIWLCKLLMMN